VIRNIIANGGRLPTSRIMKTLTVKKAGTKADSIRIGSQNYEFHGSRRLKTTSDTYSLILGNNYNPFIYMYLFSVAVK